MDTITINVQNFGPIEEANINLGDLTIFIGPQASGKSLLLQLLKLHIDQLHIRKTLELFGFTWGADTNHILNQYLGEDMYGVWSEKSEISFSDKPFRKEDLLPKQRKSTSTAEEHLFYVPAQRVVCLADGRPKNFNEFEYSTPYVLRQFSETLRQSLQKEESSSEMLFPQLNKLNQPLRDNIKNSVYYSGNLLLDTSGKRQEFKLEIDGKKIPYMAWSAGQKEFTPLLLSLYWLCPPTKVSKRAKLEYAIIEEPEMGLHPKAIISILLNITELLKRNYKVIVSTHSTLLLEFAWAIQYLKANNADYKMVAELFQQKPSAFKTNFEDILRKSIQVYFFDNANHKTIVKNISSLDAASEDNAIAEWGGLSSFSSRANDIVARAVANNESH